jgi:mannose-6-phosphate isomerase-like protein (cupin superfamily)
LWLALAACGSPQQAPASPPPGVHADAAVAIADAPAVSDDEKLAAIQKAMNDLQPVVQQCWAAVAASERFDVEGELSAQIDIATPPHVQLVTDTAKNATLSACVVKVLEAYRWAPPLAGQTIRMPFAFRAPDGQSVVDRRLVPEHAQGKIAVSVLLDENTTGNPAASMLGVTIGAGASTGMRTADRDQIWYLTANDASVSGKPAAPGDMIFVPKGGVFEVAAKTGDVHAVVVLVPGGREGIARAGALPNQASFAKPSGAIVLHAKDAKLYCHGGTSGPDCSGMQIFAEPATIHSTVLSASRLQNLKQVPEHEHAHETELIYVESGQGTLSVGGTDVAIASTSVLQIPPGVRHSFVGELSGFQVYTPAGPEQRFKK